MKLRNYALVTGGYWAFTLTDGALRMLVLLHFHDLGYSPVSLALLFLLYEFFGVVTNLIGGWVGARTGLNRTLITGLALQIVALVVLSLHQPEWAEVLSVAWVMGAQALSGIAKDLTKMSSKAAVKLVANAASEGQLFRWVAALTGSKNALKGVGFFLGGALLSWLGFDRALVYMAAALGLVLLMIIALLNEDIGRASKPPALSTILSKSPAINRLSAARFFLFASRDIWFVVALPVFLDERLGWSFSGIGAFLAAWVIGYGFIQTIAPKAVGAADEVQANQRFALMLAVVSGVLAIGVTIDQQTTLVVVAGLLIFGIVFAINSSLHSFLVLAYTTDDNVSMDVGFYYSANAAGRLVGTLLSGIMYLVGGLEAALWTSTLFVLIAWALAHRLPALTTA